MNKARNKPMRKWVNGVCFRRSIAGWVVEHRGRVLSFRTVAGRWFVRNRSALEDLGSARTLTGAYRLGVAHIDRYWSERARAIAELDADNPNRKGRR